MTVTSRSREDFESQRDLATGELSALGPEASVDTRAYYGGAIEALDWLLGRSALGPITGTWTSLPTAADVGIEHDAAEAVLHHRRDGSAHPQSWYSSVDQVLTWVLNDASGQPMASVEPEVRPLATIRHEAAILRAQLAAPAKRESDRRRTEGALAALAWLVGDADGPISGAPRSPGGPSAAEVDDEAELANRKRFAPGASFDADWQFVLGADKALDWALSDGNAAVL